MSIFDEATNMRARKWVDEQTKGKADMKMTKPSIVTKEELAKSGMSLRDYMNKQQGKTRRLTTSEKDAAFNAYEAETERQMVEIRKENAAKSAKMRGSFSSPAFLDLAKRRAPVRSSIAALRCPATMWAKPRDA